ncbi:TolC family protein [Planktosalinus lacus]|uniref:TolC family protein n=1 Tax=Planktosalinus lacus TaxID=1526573 RepID=UPI001662F344|nr:TolC family protein [Planktosalinus lacus]
MKKIFLTSLIALCTLSVFTQNKKWTLEEAVAYAIENNISIKQSELEVDQAEIQKDDAIGRFLPSLNASGSLNSNTGANINPVTNSFENTTFTSFTTGFQSNLTLFDGLRNIRQFQRAKLDQIAAQYRLGQMKDDVSLFVANAYLQILFEKENLKIIQSQIQITEDQLERTNELVDAGVVPRGDLLEIKSTLASDEQRIVRAENQIRIALINLAQILLIKDYENFDIADAEYEVPLNTIMEKPVSEVVQAAKESRYEIKISEQNLDIAEKDLQIARGAYYPTLSAFAGYNTRWADNDFLGRDFITQLYENDGTFFGAQLQVPIFNGLGVRNNVKRNKLNIDLANYRKEQAELDLESNVYQAYTDAQGALKAYEAALAAEEAQQLAYDYSRERFEVGIINSFEFSQALSRFENAQSEVIRTKYDYIFKLKLLELYFGISLY